jgi:hypothetical protein
VATSRPVGRSPRRGLRARPRLLAFLVVVVLLVVVVVLWWFQPQALFFDRVVDEDFPTVDEPEVADSDDADEADTTDTMDDPASGDAPEHGDEEQATPTEPVAVASGDFESRNRYTVTGAATAFELPDGSRTLRLEPFESTNGPDLYVYLTAADHADSDDALDADFVDLGELRGNIGNQNYDIPDEVDLAVYDTVVIWCRRFPSSFGVADLS